MFKKKDFRDVKPDFTNDLTKWYLDEHFNNYLKYQQAINLPPLKDLGVFVVIGPGIKDYVLIDGNQNIVAAFKYTSEGFGQMEARINIMKISKSFDDHEQRINL